MSNQQTIPNVGTSGSPSCAAANGELWLAWKGEGADTAIYWARTTTLAPDPYTNQYKFDVLNEKVGGTAATSDSPAIAFLNGVAYLAWKNATDGSIRWATCTDGKTWTVHAAISGSPAPGTNKSPALVSNGTSLYLAWKGETTNSIWWATCSDGKTWKVQPALAGNPAPATGAAPALASAGGAVYMAWTGTSTGASGSAVWWSKCSDGATWASQKKGPGGANSAPALAVDKNQIVWLAFILAPNIPPSTTPVLYLGAVCFSSLVDEANNEWRPLVENLSAATTIQPALVSAGADNTGMMLLWTLPVNSNICYAPLMLPTMVYSFLLPWFEIDNMRTGHLGIKNGSDTDYVSASVKVEGENPQIGTYSAGDQTGGQVAVNLSIPIVTVHGYDTVLFQYAVINSSQGPPAATKFLENAATQLYNAAEKEDLSYAENSTGLPLTMLSPQEGGALVGAQLANIAGLANFVLPELGIIVGALAGWFADNIWSFAFPDCDGPVAGGLYAFSATQLFKMVNNSDHSYRTIDDNKGATSGSGCGSNSEYKVLWSVELPAPTLQSVNSTTGAANPAQVATGGLPFTVGGQNFPDGIVAVTMNGAPAGTPTATNGRFTLTVTLPGTPTSNSQAVNITATSGVSSASLNLVTAGIPK